MAHDPTPDSNRQLFRAKLRGARRGLLAAASAACLLVGLTAYDAVGFGEAARFEADHPDDPAAALGRWRRYADWHPTWHWLGPGTARENKRRVEKLERAARHQALEQGLAALRKLAADEDGDPAEAWRRFRKFRDRFPEVESADLGDWPAALRARRDAAVARQARAAFEELDSAEGRGTELSALVGLADRFLRDHAGSAEEAEVRRRRAAYLLRLDERDILDARAYSARSPLDFTARRERYRDYLTKHPGGGAFTREAEEALRAIAADWDKHDFREVRDLFLANPGHVPGWSGPCQSYLAAHPDGRFRAAAEDLLRWGERITRVGEYRVTLRDGQFDRSVARWVSRGPKLSVELEVAGVRYGPSTIVKNRYDPEWNYEFPRRVRWRSGDPVRVRVTEHSWSDRVVLDLSSPEGDPLGLQLLAGEVWSGTNRLTFATDFGLPALPSIE